MPATPVTARAWAWGLLVALIAAVLQAGAAEAAEVGTLAFDGTVVQVSGERLRIQLEEGSQAQAGDIVMIYRYYPVVPDEVWGEERSGHTWLGRARLIEVQGTDAVVVSPLFEAQVGDRVEVASPEIAVTVASAGWVPRGDEKARIGEPFLVQRELGNRIQLTTDFVRLAQPDLETGIGDFYVGSTVDFTFWPNVGGTRVKGVESMRFGAGGFQGQSQVVAELSEDGDPLVRFLFGFAEMDFNATTMIGLVPSLKLGLNNAGFGAGGGLKLRFGTPQNSHALVGGEFTSGVGGSAMMEVHHFPSEVSQVWLSTTIQNLPAGGDRWGARIQVGVERRLTPNWWLMGAVGMSGRRAIGGEERGPTGMLGVSYNFDVAE